MGSIPQSTARVRDGGGLIPTTLGAVEGLPIIHDYRAARADRDLLVHRARFLARLGLAWHGIEAAVAIGAGIAASSIALVGFGADSVVESIAGVVLLWRLGGSRVLSEAAEVRAQHLIALSFYVIAAYVGAESIRALIEARHPDASWIGIGLAAVTLLTMPPLAWAKASVADELGSSATASEGRQNMICAYLSAALLVGLGANAVADLWWADPVAALCVAGVAAWEGINSWRGACCAASVGEPCVDDAARDSRSL